MDAPAEEVRLGPTSPPGPGPFFYKAAVLEQLWRHGVHPRPTTDPRLVHEFVSDLYRYELRRLRDSFVRREVPKQRYAATVVEIRRRYSLISLRAGEWVEPGAVRFPPGGAIIEP